MSEKTTPDSTIRIVEFLPQYARHFHDLNYEWLQEYFRVEPCDKVVLEDPHYRPGWLRLLCPGGKAGTCALLKHTERKYELAKMGVTQRFRRRGIGRSLVRTAIRKARTLGAKELVLATSEFLSGANSLYKNMGFDPADESAIGPLPYERETIVMAMTLHASIES